MKKVIFLIKIVIFSINMTLAQNLTVYNTGNSGIPDENLTKITKDDQGNIWVGVSANGVIKTDLSTWNHYNTTNTPNGFNSNTITSLSYSNGILLVGTTNGLGQYVYSTNTWSKY